MNALIIIWLVVLTLFAVVSYANARALGTAVDALVSAIDGLSSKILHGYVSPPKNEKE